MATLQSTTKPRHRPLAPNGRTYRLLAGDYPRFMLNDDGTVDWLTHEERAILQFYRRLPADLRPQMTKAMTDDGRPFEERLAEFGAAFEPRRAEIIGGLS